MMGAVALALATAGCGGEQTVKTEPEAVTVTVTTQEGDEPATEETTTQEAEEDAAGVGDAITLRGNEEGLEMAVTVLKVLDPDQGYDKGEFSFELPERGQRYFSLQIRLQNLGSVVYKDSPSNGAFLIDRQDQQYETGFTTYTHAPDLGSPTIRPGDRRVGWLTFMIPKRAKPRTFQFTLDSGFGPETGEWTLF
jgi:hypothetical protein